METQNPAKSIFLCKHCSENVEVKKRTKKEKNTDQQIVVTLKPAKNVNQDQKYTVKLPNNKNVSFGAKGFSDFTQNQSEQRKEAYIARHQPREEKYWDKANQENLYTASFWSRYLLWGEKDIFESIKTIEKDQNIVIKYTPATIKKHQAKLLRATKQLKDVDF